MANTSRNCAFFCGLIILFSLVNGGAPKNGRVVLANGSLLLKGIRKEFNGFYLCGFTYPENAQQKILSRRAKLTVIDSLDLRIEPSGIDAQLGDSIRLECISPAVLSEPVHYIWLRNGLPLTSLNYDRFYTISSGKILQMLDLKSDDAGSYQCQIAQSILDSVPSISEPSQITVATSTSEAPSKATTDTPGKFIIAPPLPQEVPVGGTAAFECLPQAHIPRVSIKWGRSDNSGIRLEQEKVEFVGTNMLLKRVSFLDQGRYTCYMSVEGEEKERASATLLVIHPPEFIEGPTNQVLTMGQSARFHCMVSASPRPNIFWYKNGEPLQEYGRVKLFPRSNEPADKVSGPDGGVLYKRDLVISEVQPSDEAVYQCFVENRMGRITKAAILQVHGEESNFKHEWQLRAETVDSRSIRVQWSGYQSPVIAYYITFYKTEGGRSNNEAVTAGDFCTGTGPDQKCSFVCCSAEQLEPFTNYTFQVTAITVSGSTSFSPISEPVMQMTGDGKPIDAPKLSVKGLPGGSAVYLEWQKIPQKYLRGTLIEYKIEYKYEGSSTSIQDVFLPPVLHDYTITDLNPNSVYQFRVLPKTVAGYPDLSVDATLPWITFSFKNKTETEPPKLSVKILSPTSLEVSWSLENAESIQTAVLSVFKDHKLLERQTFTHPEAFIMNGLDPDSEYKVILTAKLTNGQQREVSKTVKTLPLELSNERSSAVESNKIIPEPPSELECKQLGKTWLMVSWKKPVSSRKIVRYKVRYNEIPLNPKVAINASDTREVNTERPAIDLKDLKAGYKYLLSVKSFDSLGYQGPYSVQKICSLAKTAPSVPLNVRTGQVSRGKVSILWDGPVSNGGHLNVWYLVRYGRSRLEVSNSIMSLEVNSTSATLILPNVVAIESIYVTVSAVSESGRSEPSKALNVLLFPTPYTSDGYKEQNAVLEQSSENNETNSAIVVEVVSYKEGVIVGACIAIICFLICVIVLLSRHRSCFSSRRHDQNETNGGCCGVFARGSSRTACCKSEGCDAVKRLHVNGPTSNVQGLEMQTLLQSAQTTSLQVPSLGNPQADSKGCGVAEGDKSTAKYYFPPNDASCSGFHSTIIGSNDVLHQDNFKRPLLLPQYVHMEQEPNCVQVHEYSRPPQANFDSLLHVCVPPSPRDNQLSTHVPSTSPQRPAGQVALPSPENNSMDSWESECVDTPRSEAGERPQLMASIPERRPAYTAGPNSGGHCKAAQMTSLKARLERNRRAQSLNGCSPTEMSNLADSGIGFDEQSTPGIVDNSTTEGSSNSSGHSGLSDIATAATPSPTARPGGRSVRSVGNHKNTMEKTPKRTQQGSEHDVVRHNINMMKINSGMPPTSTELKSSHSGVPQPPPSASLYIESVT